MTKTIFITGSTDGIGKLAAQELAKDGHHVCIHGRNQNKVNQVVAELKALTNNSSITGFIADLSDLNAVKELAQQITQGLSQLDVLINNAGVFKSSESTNLNGLDMRFVVNYLAPYLLTQELLPVLDKSQEPRIINLSSAAQSPVSLAALRGGESLSVQAAYAESKLALTMWSFHLAKVSPSATVIAVNPGSLLNTKMVQEAYGQYWSSADKGAGILYELATGEEYETATGTYFDNDRGTFGEAHADAYNLTLVNELIAATDQLLHSLRSV